MVFGGINPLGRDSIELDTLSLGPNELVMRIITNMLWLLIQYVGNVFYVVLCNIPF